tara:strand:- start:175 stop:777 length:603 start_codon:yes stop_codon:yes gene_type:complete
MSPVVARTAVESALKDVAFVAIHKLGWTRETVTDELATHCPAFEIKSDRPIERLTIGGAAVLLDDVLRLAFPHQTVNAEPLAGLLFELAKALNPWAHDPVPPPPPPAECQRMGQQLSELLRALTAIIDELPWHLGTNQTHRSAGMPIVTGYAWSHGHVSERLIRVVLNDDSRVGRELRVWNPSGRNPVMTEAVIVGFPRP